MDRGYLRSAVSTTARRCGILIRCSKTNGRGRNRHLLPAAGGRRQCSRREINRDVGTEALLGRSRLTEPDLTVSRLTGDVHLPFHLVDGREVQDPRGLDLPTDDAARRYGQQLAHGLRPASLAVDGEKRTFIQVVDLGGKIIARCKVEG